MERALSPRATARRRRHDDARARGALRDSGDVRRVDDRPGRRGRGIRSLEARFATLRGRKFYGTFRPPAGPYRACVAIEPGDDAPALGLPTWTIPGGKYRRGKLANWSEQMPEIGRTFARLSDGAERDATRPSIEFYRSEKELVLYLPVT